MSATRVNFVNPPVVEVVCGVLFSTAKPIQVPHIGEFWQSVRSDFPNIQEAPPLPSVLEDAGGTSFEIQLSSGVDLPRTWFLSEDGQQIIQIQRDRFLLNWKKSAEQHVYPHYESVIQQFEKRFQQFRDFIAKEELGPITFRQFDLTYVNLINEHNGLKVFKKHELLVDHARDTSRSRFLPELDAFNWTTSYSLPDNAGRLNITAKSQRSPHASEEIVRLDITARGIIKGKPENTREWFDLAHIWITEGFTDITRPELHVQAIWNRTK